jgi:ketosteroid isomerase-like protein
MSDADELTALVDSYVRLLNAGDVDGVAALFEHATWRSEPHGTTLRGSDEVRPIYERLRASERSKQTTHLLTDVTIDVAAGADTATAHSRWTILEDVASGHGVSATKCGQYHDRFERVGGRWRFADRRITTDVPIDPPRADG